MRSWILILVLLGSFSCNNSISRFEKKSSDKTGVNFKNTLKYTEDFNPYTYRNFFNGGGVALGDINNDGLIDIYFTGNIFISIIIHIKEKSCPTPLSSSNTKLSTNFIESIT